MAVLKQTSPTAVTGAPKANPWNTVPSARTSTAGVRASEDGALWYGRAARMPSLIENPNGWMRPDDKNAPPHRQAAWPSQFAAARTIP
jgi:hypothetical protein